MNVNILKRILSGGEQEEEEEEKQKQKKERLRISLNGYLCIFFLI